MRAFFTLLLMVFSAHFAQGSESIPNIRFPFSRNGLGYTDMAKGYGDSNADMPHAGIDFLANDTTELVRCPFYRDTSFVIEAIYFGDYEWWVAFALDTLSQSGWAYSHLYGDPADNPFDRGSYCISTIAPVINHTAYSLPHVHIDYIADVNVLGNVAPYYDQYINPIDYFTGKPANYDIPEILEIPFLPGSDGLGIVNYYTELGN